MGSSPSSKQSLQTEMQHNSSLFSWIVTGQPGRSLSLSKGRPSWSVSLSGDCIPSSPCPSINNLIYGIFCVSSIKKLIFHPAITEGCDASGSVNRLRIGKRLSDDAEVKGTRSAVRLEAVGRAGVCFSGFDDRLPGRCGRCMVVPPAQHQVFAELVDVLLLVPAGEHPRNHHLSWRFGAVGR